MSDPFEVLRDGDEAAMPRAVFAAELRAQLSTLLGVEHVSLPPRSQPMVAATVVATPYLTVHDARAALAFYAEAFGAQEVQRVLMGPADSPDSVVGHAEFRIGAATFYLSDEFPEMGVVSPRTLGGTTVALHVELAEVDAAYRRAIDAGATVISEPAHQPHGARHGMLVDPFGHRWMLSQQVEVVGASTYGERLAEMGASVQAGPADAARPSSMIAAGRIWPALHYDDATAGIRFLLDVLGFEEELIVSHESGLVEHSQLRWPEGGTVQAASVNRGTPFSDVPTGTGSTYIVTADPTAVHARCVAAGAEIVFPLSAPDYDPTGLIFGVRDPEGNLWSFGTYAGES